MNILIAITNLSIGGAQTLLLRLVEDLVRDHNIYVYNFDLFAKNKNALVLERLSKSAKLVSNQHKFLIEMLTFFDHFCNLLRWQTSLADRFRCYLFQKTVVNLKIDLVNTHLFNSDYLVTKALRSAIVPIVMVDHGDYRFVLDEQIANHSMISQIFARVNAIVYISNSNLNVLEKLIINPHTVLRKIYNGLPTFDLKYSPNDIRQKLDISNDEIVFGMMSRGIPEKGWNEAIQSFSKLSIPKGRVHLILVGGGKYIEDLQADAIASGVKNIHFIDYTDTPEEWIQACDACLLPTYFAGESLPNSIIEYLALGKPVIATPVGGIVEMLTYETQTAGIIVRLDENGRASISNLADAMLIYIKDKNILESHSRLAHLAFEKFKIEYCIREYRHLFSQMTQQQPQANPSRTTI
jgi:L-malate glycosyltransferase